MVSRRSCARFLTSLDSIWPLSDRDLMSSALAIMVFTLSTIRDALAEVSSMPAANCWVVAELSSDTVLFSFMMASSLLTLERMVSSTWFMSASICRKEVRISLTARAITPVSSLRFTSLLPLALFWKLKFAVCLIMSVIWLMGLAILRPMKIPSIIQTTTPPAMIPMICLESWSASELISWSEVVRARYMPLSRG